MEELDARWARWLVRAASLSVPRWRRTDFVREWDAELWHQARGRGDGPAGPLWRHALGAFRDAGAIRDLEDRGEGMMGDWIGGWARDTRLAVRGLLRRPGFAVVAVFTLALGLGGSAAIYTLLDRVVLDPLPYPEPGRLVRLENEVPGVGEGTVWGMSTAQLVHLEDRSTTLESEGIYRLLGANILTPEGPTRVYGWRVTVDVLPLLGARPAAGRLIDAQDDQPGAPPVVVLSHGFWERRFGADPAVVGSTLVIDDEPYEVIGVLEPGLRAPGAPPLLAGDIWVPMQIDRNGPFWNNHVYLGLGRLAPGVAPEAAETEIARLWRELPERFPNAYSESFFEGSGMRTRVIPMRDAVVGSMARNLWILFGAVGLVLLIAWANVANLFIVRMEARRHELALRTALGAGRGAMARHLLAEGLTMSVAGGALALLVCFLGVPALVALAPESLPRAVDVAVGGDTVVYTLLLSLLAGVGLALYPLLRRPRDVSAGELATGARSGDAGPQRRRLRSLLVTGQVALALTLVVGAGLLVESLRRLGALDPGMDPEGVVAVGIYLSPARYTDDGKVWEAFRRMLEGAKAIPGVTAAGMSEELPVEGGFGCTVQGFEDPAVVEHLNAVGLSTCAGQEVTTPGYFEAARIPLLEGRTFTDTDNDDPSVGAAVVSRAFARRFWPEQDPIGKAVAPSGRTIPPFYHVVGMVGDVPAGSLEGDPAIAIYYPVRGVPDVPGNWGRLYPLSVDLVVRTDRSDPLSVVPELREAIHAVDPDVPLDHPRTMGRIIADSTARYTFTSLLMGIAAGVALLLAAVGLYGVVSYVVTRRTREIGTRIAMGARPGAVEMLFLRRSAGLVVAGLVVGVGLAAATTRLMEGLLFGVEPTEPGAFVAGAVLLAAVALLATWIPARRAARIDPAAALRVE